MYTVTYDISNTHDWGRAGHGCGMRFGKQRQRRYDLLRAEHFTPLEARELSKLPRNTPALRALRADRRDRRARFEKIAERKLQRGEWSRQDIPRKWLRNLERMYSRNHWRVQYGPTGKQQPMPRHSPNPWAMYRVYDHFLPGKGYKSPWEKRQVRRGRTRLERGQVFISRARRGNGRRTQVESWLAQLERSIATARGRRRDRLLQQKARLERML